MQEQEQKIAEAAEALGEAGAPIAPAMVDAAAPADLEAACSAAAAMGRVEADAEAGEPLLCGPRAAAEEARAEAGVGAGAAAMAALKAGQATPLAPGRGVRTKAPSTRFGGGPRAGEYVWACGEDKTVPQTWGEAKTGPRSQEWQAALMAEGERMKKYGAYKLVPLPPGQRAMPMHKVLTIKDGEPRVRLTVCDTKPRAQGETYAPTLRPTSLRVLVATTAKPGTTLHTMDVEAAYLHVDLKCLGDDGRPLELYVRLPPELLEPGEEGMVGLVVKGMYGVREAGNLWHADYTGTVKSAGFVQSMHDPCVFIKGDDRGIVAVGVHVDDSIVSNGNQEVYEQLLVKLREKYTIKVKDGAKHRFLGIDIMVNAEERSASMSQKGYAEAIVSQFGMEGARSRSTPWPEGLMLDKDGVPGAPEEPLGRQEAARYRAAVASILFLYTQTRPDLGYAISQLTRWSSSPRPSHVTALKGVLAYIGSTVDMLWRSRSGGDGAAAATTVQVWSDSDFAACIETRRSIGGYAGQLQGGIRAFVSWSSKQQSTVALSTLDAEYIQQSEGAREAKWLRGLMGEFSMLQEEPTPLRVDNAGAMALAQRKAFYDRSKHVDVKFTSRERWWRRGSSRCFAWIARTMSPTCSRSPWGVSSSRSSSGICWTRAVANEVAERPGLERAL